MRRENDMRHAVLVTIHAKTETGSKVLRRGRTKPKRYKYQARVEAASLARTLYGGRSKYAERYSTFEYERVM